MKTLLISLFLLVQCSLLAQTDQTQQIASGIARYRSFMFEDKKVERQLLGAVLKKLERLHIPEEERLSLAVSMGRMSGIETNDPIRLYRTAHKDSPYLDSLSDEELAVIGINADLYDLVNIGVLELDYPFKIRNDFSMLSELFFYNIQNGECVGEVGAGSGGFSVLLAMIYDSLQLHVNELNPSSVKYIERKFQRLHTVTRAVSVDIVFGEEHHTNFDSTLFDKIIIRNAFHHFYERDSMMASIRSSLSEDGFLFLCEKPLKAFRNPPCPSALREGQIIRYVEKAGFQLVDLMEVDRSLLFKFRKSVEVKSKKK